MSKSQVAKIIRRERWPDLEDLPDFTPKEVAAELQRLPGGKIPKRFAPVGVKVKKIA